MNNGFFTKLFQPNSLSIQSTHIALSIFNPIKPYRMINCQLSIQSIPITFSITNHQFNSNTPLTNCQLSIINFQLKQPLNTFSIINCQFNHFIS